MSDGLVQILLGLCPVRPLSGLHHSHVGHAEQGRLNGTGMVADDEALNWHVYVLMNGAGIAYTGIAINIEARLNQHNAGTGAKFTRGRGPWRIIHVEGPMPHGDALRREAVLKKDRVFKSTLKKCALQKERTT